MGYNHGYRLGGTQYNVMIGDYAGYNSNTINNRHTYVGYDSGKYIDTGLANVAIGYQAMESTNSSTDNNASYNVAVGYQALEKITDSDYNTAVGQYAGQNNTTGGS